MNWVSVPPHINVATTFSKRMRLESSEAGIRRRRSPDKARARARYPHHIYRAGSADAALSSATQAFRRATARPATQKK